MTALWQCAEVLTATGGASKGDRDWAAAGVSIDSRTTRAGDLFVAIRGPNHDGHRFTADAFARGAVAAIVEPGRTDLAPQVAVPDTLAALASLGRESRRRSSARVVAVTGSVGKTSTKEALAAALGRHKPTHSSIGSFNNHWGVPLSLARMPRESAFAAFEIGMNHAGEITPLSRLVRPHVQSSRRSRPYISSSSPRRVRSRWRRPRFSQASNPAASPSSTATTCTSISCRSGPTRVALLAS